MLNSRLNEEKRFEKPSVTLSTKESLCALPLACLDWAPVPPEVKLGLRGLR